MPALKPEIPLHKKLEALERHKAVMDTLATFLKAHPTICRQMLNPPATRQTWAEV